LKVALNGTCFNDRPSGAKQRFIGIYRDLAPRLHQVEFVVFAPSDCRMEEWFSGIPNIQIRVTPIPSEGTVGKFIHSSFFWPRTLASEKFDLFEGFHLPFPRPPTGKSILTVHDIRRLHDNWNWPERFAFRYAFGRAVKNADLIVTVSESMKQEIQGFYSHTPIQVIPNGLNAFESEQPSDAACEVFRNKFGLPRVFILAVGHLEQRKNYPNLIEAIGKLRTIVAPVFLVIVGNDSGERSRLEAQIAVQRLSQQIRVLSGLSDFEVRCAYSLCSLFVFPSTYEGFGIPILEAMAAARPMALSDIPVFREITEGRSAYFSSSDPQDMARVIAGVLSSHQEQTRLIEYGRERVRAYAYSNIGAQYDRLYASLLGLP
jgi:glycosyltransferase involved in cell wall biosynthesis